MELFRLFLTEQVKYSLPINLTCFFYFIFNTKTLLPGATRLYNFENAVKRLVSQSRLFAAFHVSHNNLSSLRRKEPLFFKHKKADAQAHAIFRCFSQLSCGEGRHEGPCSSMLCSIAWCCTAHQTLFRSKSPRYTHFYHRALSETCNYDRALLPQQYLGTHPAPWVK